jgi:hypothetical protein
MDIYSVIIFSALVLLGAGVLMVSHVRSWRANQGQGIDARDLEFRRRQFRRRMMTSALLALLAVAVLVGYVLTWWLRSPWFTLVFWSSLLAVICCVAVLAGVDVWATNHHFSRMRDDCLIEQAKLRAELRRVQAVGSNGKAGKQSNGRVVP